MELYLFDEKYLARLKAREPETESHYVAYFTPLVRSKLRSDGYSEAAVSDILQETLYRVLKAIYSDAVHHPGSLRSFVYGVCDRVCWEWDNKLLNSYDLSSKELAKVDSGMVGPEEDVRTFEVRSTVQWVMRTLSERDRKMLTALFIEEKDRDSICEEFNVSRRDLKSLIHRALSAARQKLSEAGA